ncbi:MAG TPA: TIM-barrel domain-containing protein [Vicinamibacterales bacterium]|nr:TIM-barrel domain-containing protein [Vicinamibacterales bacterium]
MSKDGGITRRDAIGWLTAAGGALLFRSALDAAGAPLRLAGQDVEIVLRSISGSTVRITVTPRGAAVADDGALVAEGTPIRHSSDPSDLARVRSGDLVVRVSSDGSVIDVASAAGDRVQRLALDPDSPGMTFTLGTAPVLGFGEGGPQFDRRGNVYPLRNGQGGYQLATHGGRVPIQWLIGTAGWAMFVHQPYGSFDLSGTEGRFDPQGATLPLDVFVVASRHPEVVMREYARITGMPELPALWTFGYLQSHRTLAGPDEVMSVARTMRAKKLPCDALIYLGTDFSPSGWNTHNGEFTWNQANFPHPARTIDQLHAMHYKVVLHVVIEGRHLTGTVNDSCEHPEPSGRTPDGKWPAERSVGCYWPYHKPLMDLGVDGWWPDQGDGFDAPSRLERIRMYWEGPQLWRPDERPFALHRNGAPGMQRYGAFLWSGDVQSRWETLATHVPVAINCGLSGIPYWGTDIGGFVPTAEFTGELFVRWFQFGAFCPLFRSHGRDWHLHLPWGWDGGDGGPDETKGFHPDPAEMHNKQVEPICRQYLDLRYRLLPYTYSIARDTCQTGLPMMRALWLHYPGDPVAVARGDEFLWGRDILVAPVTEKGASARRLYLPDGDWFDFWTGERVAGGREVSRAVDLATLPLYVRAGSIIPMGPAKQYTGELSPAPLSLDVYPGADGAFLIYLDDGESFEYRDGAWTGIQARWSEGPRTLSLRLAPGSRMLSPLPRAIDARLHGGAPHRMMFDGRPLTVRL